MAITTHACKLNTNTAIKFISSCSSVLHAYISTTRRQPTKSPHRTRYLHCHKLFSINRNLCCHCRAVCGRAFCQGLSSKKTLSTSASLADREIMEQQFEEFKQLLEDSGNVRERLRIIVADLDSVTRVMQADLLQVHYSSRSPEILKKAKSHIGKLKELYGQLAEVIKGTPGQYYRYHEHWRNQTNTVVFLIVYLHWLETGNLLSYAETQNTLGLNPDEFGLDIEDYLIAHWWVSFGGQCPQLQKFAVRVLNQTSCASGCERNWFIFEHIHMKKRNCLEKKWSNDLVFVQYNLRLRCNQMMNRRPDLDPIVLDNIDLTLEWVEETKYPEFDADFDIDMALGGMKQIW